MTVTIIAAALNIDGLIISKPQPARHGDIIHPFYAKFGRHIGPDEQGFLTSEGKYVDRSTAFAVAHSAKQLNRAALSRVAEGEAVFPDLFSEDLW